MPSIRLNGMTITTEKQGATRILKSGLPSPFGKYSEIKTTDYEFRFSLLGEIKSIRGLKPTWPHPYETLKRTDANDWVYNTAGSVIHCQNLKEYVGDYYVPCLPYPSNAVWNFSPYSNPNVAQAFGAWSQLFGTLHSLSDSLQPASIREFVDKVLKHDEDFLHKRADKLHEIIGGAISVLPPDTRHVDYEIVPLVLADGCLYHCNFCTVKSSHHFKVRSQENIQDQISRLKDFYSRGINNYTALFLGNHDALHAGEEVVMMAAEDAYEAFEFSDRSGVSPGLFLFGSVDSLLKAEQRFFDRLENSPYHVYLNIGFESVDEATLSALGKPIKVSKIRSAFQKLLDLNCKYPTIDVSANFLLSDQFSARHNESIVELLSSIPEHLEKSGTVYLSPLVSDKSSENLLPTFFDIKRQSRLPTFLYLIQRM